MVVEVGLVTGVSAATTPTGSATCTIPESSSREITPTVFVPLGRRRSLRRQKYFYRFILEVSALGFRDRLGGQHRMGFPRLSGCGFHNQIYGLLIEFLKILKRLLRLLYQHIYCRFFFRFFTEDGGELFGTLPTLFY